MNKKRELQKLHIKLPHDIGKVYYVSELPTKKEIQSLIFYRITFFIGFVLALYLMYDYLQDPFHYPRYKQMNDGRIIDIEPNIFFIYVIVAIYTLVQFIFYSLKIYIVGNKGCVLYTFRIPKSHSMKQRLFCDDNFKLEECMKYSDNIKYRETLSQMYDYFKIRREG